jgi:hypothetical protein
MLEYYLNTLIKLDQHQGVKFQSTVDKNVLQVSREKKRKSDIWTETLETSFGRALCSEFQRKNFCNLEFYSKIN